MTRYLERLFAGEQPSVTEWNEHLAEFHHSIADATSKPMMRLKTADHRNSYENFADEIAATARDARSILDVGCGNGVLLDYLRAHFADARLTGIDLSATEIERASARIPEAHFVCGDVTEFVPPERFDAIVAHLVFGVMSDAKRSLAHVRTLLRPGGKLIFAIEDNMSAALPARLLEQGVNVVRGQYPKFVPSIPGRIVSDPDEVLVATLEQAGFSRARILRRFRLEAIVDAQAAWEFARHSYPIGLLDHELLAHMRARIHDGLEAIAHQGHVCLDYPVKIVVADA